MARRIMGRITDKVSGSPVAGALIKAFDKDNIGDDDFMNQAYTDNNGNYSISYRRGSWDNYPHFTGLWRPDIFIKVFRPDADGHQIKVGQSKVFDDHRVRHDLTINMSVNEPNSNARTITGRIMDKNRNPLQNILVRAFDEDVGSDQFMGEVRTDANGDYRITYTNKKWDNAPRDTVYWRPDIYVVVLQENNANQLVQLGKSKVYSDQKLADKRVIHDMFVEPRPWSRIVHGRITWKHSGAPVRGVQVTAYDSDALIGSDTPASSEQMGIARTNDNGEYMIPYRSGSWDDTPLVKKQRPDVFTVVNVGGYHIKSAVFDDVPHRTGQHIDMAIDVPFHIVPKHLGQNETNIWLGWFSQEIPRGWRLKVYQDGGFQQELNIDGDRLAPWLRVGQSKVKRFYCKTFRLQTQPNTRYRLEIYHVGDDSHVVANSEFDSLSTGLPTDPDNPFNIFLGSCFSADHSTWKLRRAFDAIWNSNYRPHLKLFVGDQVYLDHSWERYQQRHSTKKLTDMLTRRYAKSWDGYLGEILPFGANYFISDDHEYFNNFPTPPSFIPILRNRNYRRTWRSIAESLYHGIQQGNPVDQLSIGDDIEIFIADVTRNRAELPTRLVRYISGSPTHGFFMRQTDFDRLINWIENLDKPGILVIGRTLFNVESNLDIPEPHGEIGLVKDFNIQDFEEQYEPLVDAIMNAQHDIVILTGDVHFGRVADCTNKQGKKVIEVISSPLSVLTSATDRWELGVDKDPKTFPHKAMGSVDQPAKITYQRAVRAYINNQNRAADHFKTISLSKQNNTVKMVVSAWLVRADLNGNLPLKDYDITYDLD